MGYDNEFFPSSAEAIAEQYAPDDVPLQRELARDINMLLDHMQRAQLKLIEERQNERKPADIILFPFGKDKKFVEKRVPHPLAHLMTPEDLGMDDPANGKLDE